MNAYGAGASGGPDTSATGAGGFEAGLDDDLFAGADHFELGLDGFDGPQIDFLPGADAEQEINGDIRQTAKGIRENDGNDKAAEAGVGPEDVGPPTPAPSDALGQDADGAHHNGKGNKNTSKKSKAKKLQQPVRDRFITLGAEEITKNRQAYSGEMRKFNLVKDLERFEKGQKDLVLDMMTSLPLGGMLKLSAARPLRTTIN